jgi:hypothetical protein
LDEEDLKVLEYCKNSSIFPILPAVLNIEPSYPGFLHSLLFRSDLLHTMIGLLRNWIFYVYVILCRVSKLRRYQHDYFLGPSRLDVAIAEMHYLLQGCMPYEITHFHRGMPMFCRSSKSASTAKLSQSGMSKLDSSKVASLVLQMLICKYQM